jgi:hypothetical protein
MLLLELRKLPILPTSRKMAVAEEKTHTVSLAKL